MLSYASSEIGRGWAFGLREAMDQTGAVLGPLAVAWAIARHTGYHYAFGMLVVPASPRALHARSSHSDCFPRRTRSRSNGRPLPHPRASHARFGCTWRRRISRGGHGRLPAHRLHFAKDSTVARGSAALFALAMASAAISAPLVGRIYDRMGLVVVAGASLLPAAAAPLLFLGGASARPWWRALGASAWGYRRQPCAQPLPT